MITVAVGDDHPIVRAGVVQMLGETDDIEVIGEAADGSALLALVLDHNPHVVLTDYRMPLMDGASLAAALRDAGSPTHVLVLSAFTEAAIVYRCLDQGAAGFVSKDAGTQEIYAAIRDVAAGRQVLPPALVPGLLDQIRQRGQASLELSPREREILTAVAAGRSTPSIATAMHLAPSTVKTYLQRLYDKLDVNDRGAAVAEAMRRGILQ